MSAQLLHQDGSISEATSPPIISPRKFYWSPRMMCITTKPVVVILLWVFVVACVFRGIQYTSVFAVSSLVSIPQNSFLYQTCCYMFINVIALSFPIGGFLADVYFGRYKVVTISLAFIWTALLLLTIALITTLFIDGAQDDRVKQALKDFMYVILGLAFVPAIPGMSGVYSNVVQLSLDQLQDAPSHVLGIFLHWLVWVGVLGQGAVFVVYVIISCSYREEDIIKNAGYIMGGLVFVFLSFLLVLNRFTKHWFYAANIVYNPYKMVVDVLKYVRTHKYPTRHSAMHWTNGEQPSRFDFAKDCYGGPFTSSQVEDVKTLGRVVLVLLSVGPVFALCVPISYLIFPLFSFHTVGLNSCSFQSVLFKSGALSYLLGLISLPVIMWTVYCVLKNRVPKILTRLEIGIFLFIIAVFSMLVIDLIGHNVANNTTNTTRCLFIEDYNLVNNDAEPSFSFGFSMYVLIIPSCFNIVSYSLVLVTVLEFISAQAPQPMKGLVFGVFFAIKGMFILLAAVLLVPFSLATTTTILSSYVSCGFGYFFLTLAMSLFGLVLFACVRRRYKYRMRDEEPFSQAVVEEIFERRLQHNTEDSLLDSPDIVPGSSERRSSVPVRKPVCVTESEEERVRASEWFVAGHATGAEPERLLSLSRDWYGTFQYDDSERMSH